MWALGVIAGVIVAGAIARFVLGRDSVPPMERHLRALEALRDLAEQPRPPVADLPAPELAATNHVHILEGVPTGVRPARPEVERPTIQIRPQSGRAELEIPGSPAEPAAPADPPAVFARPHRRRPTIPTRIPASAAVPATVVVAVAIVVAVGLGERSPAHGSASATRTNRAPHPVTAVSTTTPPPTTTTSVPVAAVVTRSTTGATVAVHSPFQLTLRANGTCWVEITDATGHSLFSTTLHAGDEQQIPGAQPIVVRLGYTPAMTISVDGVDLDLTGLSQTANLNFQTT